jgi:hypothetical protein
VSHKYIRRAPRHINDRLNVGQYPTDNQQAELVGPLHLDWHRIPAVEDHLLQELGREAGEDV